MNEELIINGTGAIESPKDYRDISLSSVVAPITLPDSYEVDVKDIPIWNQMQNGSCFVAGTKVRLSNGNYKDIEDLITGEDIIDAYGEAQTITEKFSRLWQGNFYKIRVFGIADPIIVTPEHPILTTDGFKEAKSITKNDYIVVSPSLVNKDKTDFSYENDNDFLTLLGLYLAEGNVENGEFGGRVTWTFNSNELHLVKIVADAAKRLWNKEIKPYFDFNHNTVNVRINNKDIANIFRELGSTGSINKRINTKLLTLDPEKQLNILKGWLLGDGSFKDKKQIDGVSISKKLVIQMFDICLRNGINPSYTVRPAKEKHKEAYVLSIYGNDKNKLFPEKYPELKKRLCGSWRYKQESCGLSKRVYSVDKLIVNKDINAQTVYNIETTGSHTYTANMLSVHNCVGHAGAKYKQVLDHEDTKKVIPLSARFLYAVCKCLDGYPDQGTYPRLSMKVLKDYGCATEVLVPNDSHLDHESYVFQRNITNISVDATAEAKKYAIASYASVDMSTEGIKRAIFQSYGCSALVKYNRNWCSDINGNITWEASKILPIRPSTVNPSGHEVYFYKYETVGNDMKVWFINSFSNQWGDNGKGWFWYSEYKPYIAEAWTAIDIPQDLLDNVNSLPKEDEFKYNFVNKIKLGDTSEDVKALQTALKIDGTFTYPYVTGYFGTITAKAVLAFQMKYNIKLSWYERYVLAGKLAGPKTLLVLNQKFNKVN